MQLETKNCQLSYAGQPLQDASRASRTRRNLLVFPTILMLKPGWIQLSNILTRLNWKFAQEKRNVLLFLDNVISHSPDLKRSCLPYVCVRFCSCLFKCFMLAICVWFCFCLCICSLFKCFRSSHACHVCLVLFLPVQGLLTCF